MSNEYKNSFQTLVALAETFCTLGDQASSKDGFITVDQQLLASQGNTLIFHLYQLDEAVQEINSSNGKDK